MKLTRTQLKQLIKEELENTILEQEPDQGRPPPTMRHYSDADGGQNAQIGANLKAIEKLDKIVRRLDQRLRKLEQDEMPVGPSDNF